MFDIPIDIVCDHGNNYISKIVVLVKWLKLPTIACALTSFSETQLSVKEFIGIVKI